MKVEVLRAFGNYSVGTIIPEMPGNVARSMIGRSMVREVVDDDLKKQFRPPVDRMIKPTQITRRNRPQTA